MLRNPAARADRAEVRVCDQAATALSSLLFGAAEYHPLLKDADKRLADLKALMDRWAGHWRRLTPAESRALNASPWRSVFVPDIRPLDRPATADDVAALKAVFHLDGQGKVARRDLPATGTYRGPLPQWKETPVLIVQAEVRPDGKTLLGVIGIGGVWAVEADEIGDIAPLKQ